MNSAPVTGTVIASGNLATSRRTIMGVLGQCGLLGIEGAELERLVTGAGLPSRALEELDFPISLDQEFIICNAMLRHLPRGQSPILTLFNALEQMGIESLGVLGMAMRHAETAIDALTVCLTYPQLTWGHSRMVVRSLPNISLFSFAMERPDLRDVPTAEVDRLVEYCLVLDLLSSLRNIQDMLGSTVPPISITLPFPAPDDWPELSGELPCPVEFDASEASLAYPATLNNNPLPRANALIYRSYVSLAEKQSQMLAEDFSLTERVTRWLWAYTPPPKRGEIAGLLNMSERNLTRQLGRENTSYSKLLAGVQEERARNFLRNPALSITEISDRLGYAEPAVFSRAFSNWVGVSPLRWRKSGDPLE